MTFVTLAMSDVFGNYIPCSILLPNFYGFSGEWSYFKDKFELLVDQNIQLFRYLQSVAAKISADRSQLYCYLAIIM